MTTLRANLTFGHAEISSDCHHHLHIIDGELVRQSFIFSRTLLSFRIARSFLHRILILPVTVVLCFSFSRLFVTVAEIAPHDAEEDAKHDAKDHEKHVLLQLLISMQTLHF